MSPAGPVRRAALCLGVTPLAAALLAGCAVTGSVSTSRVEQKSVNVGQAPLVVINTFNGRITVTAGGDGVVQARITSRGSGTSQAEAEEDLRHVQVAFDYGPGERVTITARRTDKPVILGNSGADLEVTVPAGSRLEMRTSNGRIESANVQGSIIARTSNGAITTRGGKDLDLDTTNGPVSVSNATGKLNVRTSDGPVDIVAAQDVLVSAQTTNAGMTFSGSLSVGSHVFETINSDLTLTLPGNAAFSIDGSTSNGLVATDFPLDYTAATITGTTGVDVVTSIKAVTTNGDLRVMAIRP